MPPADFGPQLRRSAAEHLGHLLAWNALRMGPPPVEQCLECGPGG